MEIHREKDRWHKNNNNMITIQTNKQTNEQTNRQTNNQISKKKKKTKTKKTPNNGNRL